MQRCVMLVFVLAGGWSLAAAEALEIEVIPLTHRLAEEVVPILQPLVAEGGTVTGMNRQLIIKTTPANLEQVKAVLSRIDHAPRNLLISVRQDIDGKRDAAEGGLSGRYRSGHVNVEVPDTGRRGTVIEGRGGDGAAVRYRSLETRTRTEDRNVFRVRAVEGRAAFIHTGQSVPVPVSNAIVAGGGVIIRDGVEYRDVTSGFYVLPRLQGDNVSLLVSPHLSRRDPAGRDRFGIQDMETTVTGRLGQWIPVGGTARRAGEDGRRNAIRTRSREQERRGVLIKVEEVTGSQ